MKINRIGPPEEITLAEFAERHDLTLRVEDKGERQGALRFEVYFLDVRTQEYPLCGTGSTEQEAIASYAHKLSRRHLQIVQWIDTKPKYSSWIPIPWLK